jgi:FAD/FMN-containing dehydrogenase
VCWGEVAEHASVLGLAPLAGFSPTVGVVGYSLGGGIGWLARKHGLQANAVTALEIVTADAQLIRADAEHHADLFWALRGGGGNFGVVTAIEFAVHPVDDLYAGAMFFPFERSSEVLKTWSALLPSLPDELMSWASVIHFPPIPDVPAFARGRSFAVVMAAYLGNEADGRDLLWPLRDLGPLRDTFAMVPPVVLSDLAMDPLDPLPFHLTHQLLDALPAQTIDEVMAKVGPGSGRGPTVTMLQFRHMGGALARTTPDAGARATLPGEVCMVALGVVMDEAMDAAVRGALADVDAAVLPHRAGDYPNFVEAPADASGFFEPAVWERLREVKAQYDPTDRFAGNLHIPPAGRT